jgi:hypothetical protein
LKETCWLWKSTTAQKVSSFAAPASKCLRFIFRGRASSPLKGRPGIWRSIAMRGDQTLERLHEEIFRAFDRFDEHLYSFYFPKAPRRRGPVLRPKEYVAPLSFGDSGSGERRFNAGTTTLDDLHLKVGQTFEYLFDYGDSWWHVIEVQHVGPVTSGRGYPELVGKRGQSPPQYSGLE